jgi:excisionase family DNA binding protein
MAALETLAGAGFSIAPPAAERCRLLSVAQVAELLGVGQEKARSLAAEVPGSVRLPGGDIRVRLQELERWLERHPLRVEA